MAETTENYGLLKPEETDYYSIEIQNENMDAIDAALKAQADGIATKASAGGLAAHTSNTTVHVTTQEKVAWDGKADSAALTAHTGNTTTHITAAERTAWNSKADAAGMTSHTGNTTVHITAGERSSWNGKAEKSIRYTATLTTAGWSASAPFAQTVTVTGILATDTPIIDVILSGTASTAILQSEAWGCVGRITTAANSITVYCYEEKPITAIPIQLKVVR